MSLNTCISYLNNIFQIFLHMLKTCSVFESATSYLFLDNICLQSPLFVRKLLTLKVSSSDCSLPALDKSNVYCVVTEFSFVL